MKMSLKQTKLAYYTMQLDLKAQEYGQLCKQLAEMEELNLDANAKEFAYLKKQFEKNLSEIKQIKEQLKKLNEN